MSGGRGGGMLAMADGGWLAVVGWGKIEGRGGSSFFSKGLVVPGKTRIS